MRGSVTVTGEYVAPKYGEECFTLKTEDDGNYYFNQRRFDVEMDTKWAAGTLLEAGGFIWVVMVTSSIYDDGEDDREYYVYRCNQLGVPAGTAILRYSRSDFATTFPDHRVVYQVTGERTK